MRALRAMRQALPGGIRLASPHQMLGKEMIHVIVRHEELVTAQQIHAVRLRGGKAGGPHVNHHIVIQHRAGVEAHVSPAVLPSVTAIRAFAPERRVTFTRAGPQKL